MRVRHAFRTVALAGLAVLAVSASAPGAPTTPPLLRHEDPATVPVEYDPASAFAWYRMIAAEFTGRRYADGRRFVLRLDQANLPPDVASLVGDINATVLKEGSILEALDGWMHDSLADLQSGNPERAAVRLRELQLYAKKGDLLLSDLTSGLQDLAGRVQIEGLAQDAPERQAYADLRRAAARFKALVALQQTLTVSRLPSVGRLISAALPSPTKIALDVAPVLYPGKLAVIRGTSSELATRPSGRFMTLQLDGRPLAQFPIGEFEYDFTVPETAASGPHLVTAAVPIQGRYLAWTAEKVVQIIRAAPELRADLPRVVVAPGRLAIRGTVGSELGPAAGATVTLRVGHSEYETQSSADGKVAMTVGLPVDPRLVGPQEVSVRITPVEPWHRETDQRAFVFVANVLTTGLGAALVVAAGVMVSRRRRRVGYPEPAGQPVPVPEPIGALPAALREGNPLLAQILAAYAESLRMVASAGTPVARSMTLREIARAAVARLRAETFAQLTALVETALYAPAPVTEEIVAHAGSLAARLRGELVGVVS